MSQEELAERFSRQRDIIPPERLQNLIATVVGVGAIGRQVALQLTAMGITQLQLVDFDRVELSNLASQGYLENDLDVLKVEATSKACQQINHMIEVEEAPERFKRAMEVGSVLFSCVDSINVRKLIWESVKDRVRFLADGRMSAEVLRVLVAYDASSRQHYPTTLFDADEAYTGACTARTTIYSANIAAGLMLAQFAKWLRRLPVEPDVQMNLLAAELSVS